MSSTDTLKIDIDKRTHGTVVRLAGSASMELCDQLNDALLEACQDQPRVLVVDMKALTFVCSLGLGGLVAAYLRVQKYGGRFALASPAPAIADMLDTTKLGSVLPVFTDTQRALENPS